MNGASITEDRAIHHDSESMSGERELCVLVPLRRQVVDGFRGQISGFQQWRLENGLAGNEGAGMEEQGDTLQISRRADRERLAHSNPSRLEQSLRFVRHYVYETLRFWRQEIGRSRPHNSVQRVETVDTINWNLRSTSRTKPVRLTGQVGPPPVPPSRDRYVSQANQAPFSPFVVRQPYSFNLTRWLEVLSDLSVGDTDMAARAQFLYSSYGFSIFDISDLLHIHPHQVKEWIDA